MSVVKKFINNAVNCVDENLRGFVAAYPGLQLHPMKRTVILPKSVSNGVGVISGGGGGHEPFVAGFVGQGMLSGGVSGSVFTSPPPGNIFYALKTVAESHKGGVLVIIPNYTGDCLNFGLAIERAKLANIKAEGIIVHDDCSLLPDKEIQAKASKVGGRGICGIVFLIKMSCALADQGLPLEKISAESNEILKNIFSMGACIVPCSLPGQGYLFTLKDDEIDIGIGIHGEAGASRIKYTTAKDIVGILLKKIATTLKLKENDQVALMLNNLGGSSKLEEHIMLDEAVNQLGDCGVQVCRAYVGSIMTSLQMAGMQISILKIADPKWIDLLDAPTLAPAWPGNQLSIPTKIPNIVTRKASVDESIKNLGIKLSDNEALMLKNSVISAAKAVIENESKLNQLDAGVGDGDCGSTLKQLANEVLKLESSDIWRYPCDIFNKMANIAENKMGGTSGAVYSLFFTNLIPAFEKAKKIEPQIWVDALKQGVQGIMKYSQARLGDRTLLDSLIPAIDELQKIKEKNSELKTILANTLKAASEGSIKTIKMRARVGRASYVSDQIKKDVDAGSHAVVVTMNAIVNQLEKMNIK